MLDERKAALVRDGVIEHLVENLCVDRKYRLRRALVQDMCEATVVVVSRILPAVRSLAGTNVAPSVAQKSIRASTPLSFRRRPAWYRSSSRTEIRRLPLLKLACTRL